MSGVVWLWVEVINRELLLETFSGWGINRVNVWDIVFLVQVRRQLQKAIR